MKEKKTIFKKWKDILCNYLTVLQCVCITICTALMIMYFFGLAHDNEWFSFWGAIIAGLFTFGGVWWTISDQDKKGKKIKN